MSITKSSFGKIADGRDADIYTLTNHSGAFVKITNYGGIVVEIHVPDKNGRLGDVILGCKKASDYSPLNDGYLGALIGRVGNRIARGECTLNGQALHLAKNSNGQHLHGGNEGFNTKLWTATPLEGLWEDSLVLKYTSPDGEENYPGTLRVMVTYTFTDLNEFKIHYMAQSDQDTLCNLTNHTYFNIGGEGSGTIANERIQINADTFTVADSDLIPTGENRPVGGTPFDLRTPRRIADGIALVGKDEQLTFGGGYDHNFPINGSGMREAAIVLDDVSGRQMRVLTDMPAMQFYSGNMLSGVMSGKCGHQYGPREALCLETQYTPDSINHPNFPDSILRAGQHYDFTTVYAFSVQ